MSRKKAVTVKGAYPMHRVRYTDEGRPYVVKKVRGVDGKVRSRRRYGRVEKCTECDGEFLQIKKDSPGFCSISCAKRGKPSSRVHGVKAVKLWCDKLFSMAIREVGRCERCGEDDYQLLQCAHVFSRRYTAIRWTWDNAFCLCRGCHYWGEYNPLEWEDFCIDKIGRDRYEELKQQARHPIDDPFMFYEITLERMEVLLEMKSGIPRPDAWIRYTERQSERWQRG